MSKRHHRKKNSLPIEGEGRGEGLESFFTDILPFIENLEKDDHILLVLPGIPERGTATHPESPEEHRAPESPALTQGIVIGSDLALEINADYVQRMAEYTRQCGSLESYFDFRARNPKWAAAHNPDQLLLNICLSARLVISYRYGLTLGQQTLSAAQGGSSPSMGSTSSDENTAQHSLPIEGEGWGEGLPLFITMMGDESVPHSIGYELDGEVTLEQYKESTKNSKNEDS